MYQYYVPVLYCCTTGAAAAAARYRYNMGVVVWLLVERDSRGVISSDTACRGGKKKRRRKRRLSRCCSCCCCCCGICAFSFSGETDTPAPTIPRSLGHHCTLARNDSSRCLAMFNAFMVDAALTDGPVTAAELLPFAVRRTQPYAGRSSLHTYTYLH